MVAPDDTPTRLLQRIDKWLHVPIPSMPHPSDIPADTVDLVQAAKGQILTLRAEVSRLREQSLDYDRFVAAVFKEPIITGREYPPPVTDEDGGMSYKVAIEWLVKRSLDADRAEADVSRLQQERDDLKAAWNYRAGSPGYIDENARLMEENALLRRSLEMLTKQMAE